MNTKKKYATVEDNPLYQWYLGVIKNYRDAVWNLELAVQQVRNTFELEYDTTIEEFLNLCMLQVPVWMEPISKIMPKA